MKVSIDLYLNNGVVYQCYVCVYIVGDSSCADKESPVQYAESE